MGIESNGAGVVSNRDELCVFVSQYWSIPKQGPDSTDGGLQKSIPEKLNGSDMLFPGPVYKFEKMMITSEIVSLGSLV